MSDRLIYLASGSPRRRELLTQMGVPFERIVSEVDETPRPDEGAHDYVLRLAVDKACAGWEAVVREGRPPRLLLAADTTVALDDQILGKPADSTEATAMLRRLSGRTHEVLTAVAITDGARTETVCSVSEVDFKPLSETEIAAYVTTGEPLDKAGSYGAQGLGALFVTSIRGSFSGVVGLPIFETAALLARFDYHCLPRLDGH
jgi:septum formation protein